MVSASMVAGACTQNFDQFNPAAAQGAGAASSSSSSGSTSGGGGGAGGGAGATASSSSSSGAGGSMGSGGSGGGGPGPFCGDGTTNGAEECDDGNNLPADGCSADCKTEDPESCPGPTIMLTQAGFMVKGDTTGASNDSGALPCGGGASGDFIYSVTAAQGGTITATLEGNFSVLLYARAACPGMNNVDLGCSMGASPAVISLPVNQGDTVYLFVDGRGGQPEEGPFTLSLALQ